MHAESTRIRDTEKKTSAIVYEGFLTVLVTRQCNLSTPYYTSVRRALINMGCIRQLRRGGSSSPSQWEMIYEPTIEAFMRQVVRKVPKQTKDEMTNENILALNNRITELEDWQAEINGLLIARLGTTPTEESA